MRRGAGTVALCCLLAWLVPAAAEPVSVRTVRLGDVLEVPAYSAPATVVARNAPRLAAEIDARVIELPLAVGDRVAAGDLLARLDCRRHESIRATAAADLARSEARRHFAEQQLRRARNLQRNQSISEELLDQRRTDLAAAEAEAAIQEEALRRASLDVENCELRAPFDAVVTVREASVGSYLARGSPLIALLETAGQEVSVALRQDQVASVKAAPALVFESNGDTHPLRLRALLPLVDGIARTREARLAFLAEGAIAGSAGRLVWQGERTLLPADYLVRRGGAPGVFVAEGEHARFVPLPGAEDGRPNPVALAQETRLITDGRQRLSDGDAIRTLPDEDTR